MPKFSIGGVNKRGGGVRLAIPKIVIDIASPDEIALEAAREQHALAVERISQGKDASGVAVQIKESTIERRKRDMSPPEQTRSRSKRKKRPRWKKRYPNGKGSSGGVAPLVDSGTLRDGLTVTPRGSGAATVDPPSSRIGAVIGMLAGGSREQIDVIGVDEQRLKQTAQHIVDRAIKKG